MINTQNTQTLETFLAGHNFTGHARTFKRRIKPIAFKAAEVKQNIWQTVIGNNKTITPTNIKPFYQTINTDDCDAVFVLALRYCLFSTCCSCRRFRHLLTQPITQRQGLPDAIETTNCSNLNTLYSGLFATKQNLRKFCTSTLQALTSKSILYG